MCSWLDGWGEMEDQREALEGSMISKDEVELWETLSIYMQKLGQVEQIKMTYIF